MDKLYFSDIQSETWQEAEYMTYIIVPRKWWNIKHWKLAIDFSKEVRLFFMRKETPES